MLGSTITCCAVSVSVDMNATIQSIKGLASELTPDIEEGVRAIELEKERLNASIDVVRQELEKVDVTGVAAENLEEARAALDKAKAEVKYLEPIFTWHDTHKR